LIVLTGGKICEFLHHVYPRKEVHYPNYVQYIYNILSFV